MNEFWLIDPREAALDEQNASLIENIRNSLMIQAEMFRRILETKPRPTVLLAELLEETGNRYLDFSELVSLASNTHARSTWNENGSWPQT